MAASGLSPWPGLGLLAAEAVADPPGVYALDWSDDPYSVDLAKQFIHALKHADYKVQQPQKFRVFFSVGGYYSPNPSEAQTIRRLVSLLAAARVNGSCSSCRPWIDRHGVSFAP